ncbi:hypothetical protein [Szabonella alba]|uniref:Uncharacterized protein n=1 Tax=Szabonella alba TaxID=2804194 RepID=A0A8K0VAE1_9RHOB|nr:hypothetical protein [Szabonella alba]MBL4915612.1 hypothetical protein [Szabonella alba]
MSDLSVSADELKRLLKMAAKSPLPFAYCPGPNVEGDLFALHRTKSGEVLAKSLRAAGDGNKVAFGTAEVEGKLVSLRCDRLLPSLAKKLKKFLRANQLNRNVRILDANGNVIEEDIEDLPDTGPEDQDESAVDVAEAPEAEDQDAEGPETDPAQPSADLAARAKALHPRVMAIPDPAGQKLRQAFAGAGGLIRSGDDAGAVAALDRIEDVLTRMSAATSDPAPAQQTDQPTDPAGSTAERKLLEAAAALVKRINALGEETARASLIARMKDVVSAIREAAVERAINGMKQVQRDLLLAEGQGADSTRDPLDVWNAAKEATDVAIGALQSKLGQIADPDLERIAKFGLNGITEGNQTALMKHLFAYRQSTGEARAKAAAALRSQTAAYRAFLQSNELIDLCENNPFGVAVDLRGPLGTALAEIDRLAA